jgi:hypothetical protein
LVKGAKVSGGGDSGVTDKQGKATLDIGATKKKTITIAVKRAGYTTATRRLTVTH